MHEGIIAVEYCAGVAAAVARGYRWAEWCSGAVEQCCCRVLGGRTALIHGSGAAVEGGREGRGELGCTGSGR